MLSYVCHGTRYLESGKQSSAIPCTASNTSTSPFAAHHEWWNAVARFMNHFKTTDVIDVQSSMTTRKIVAENELDKARKLQLSKEEAKNRTRTLADLICIRLGHILNIVSVGHKFTARLKRRSRGPAINVFGTTHAFIPFFLHFDVNKCALNFLDMDSDTKNAYPDDVLSLCYQRN